jgi:hypothetical protein
MSYAVNAMKACFQAYILGLMQAKSFFRPTRTNFLERKSIMI